MSTSPVQVLDGGERVSVTLDDGGELEADLLVGADGIHSTVRSLVFGAEPAFFRHLGYHSAAFVFDAPDIHDAVRDRAFLTDTVERQLGLYGLRDGRVAAFAVHRTQSEAMPADRRAAVREAYRGMGWVVSSVFPRRTRSTTTKWVRSSCRRGPGVG
jgi:2-polyprenyl-6-methoxyphenol hydroxylase-like FAD-dependent oxidoreductase